jgi:carbamoyl-phosphate synthase large subunit
MGGQTALNCALDLWHNGVLAKYTGAATGKPVELIGATPEAIDKAEDRLKFKDAMTKIGLGSAKSGIAHSMDEAWGVQKKVGFPPSSAPASPWVAPVAALPTTPKSLRSSANAAWKHHRPMSC